MIRVSLVVLLLLCAVMNAVAVNAAPTTQPVNIIFDTDMGSDCDDAGALAILHKLADDGEANILGVIFSSGKNRYGVGVCDAINTYYGRGDLPLGQYQKDDVGDPKDRYCKPIATNTSTYKHDVVDSAPEMLRVYKALLKKQPDGSVTIVTVGHPHALSYLVEDAEALALVRRKVKQCVSMAGAPDTPQEEWNFSQPDVREYVANVLAKWPTPHYFSPAGEKIITGHRKLPATPAENPAREAYRRYDGEPLKNGRPSWDLVAVLYAVRPHLFKVESGTLTQQEKRLLLWTNKVNNPPRYRATPLASNAEVEALLEDLMSAPPKTTK